QFFYFHFSPCFATCSSRSRRSFNIPPFLLQFIGNQSELLNRQLHHQQAASDRTKMECVFGLVGRDFAIVVADSSAVHSILVHKSNEDKIMVLDSHKLVAASGEPGDRVQFTEYIQKNVSLYQFRNGIPLTTAAAANFTRGELATALRKNPYQVNVLMAGYDKETGPSLYYIDYIATLHKVDRGAFGYGSYFCLSMMDRLYHSGMSVDEAIDLVDKCIMEIRSRLVVAPPNFVIKIVDKDGAREYAWRESVRDVALA
ncbi:Proteasome subunit beta type-2-A, partial [Linum grandiflorum]